MHAAVAFIQDLAIVMIVAGVVTIVFHLLRQPVVLGYILAGVIIGPHTPPFPLIPADHKPSIDAMSELGVIFLMFSLGLHFSLRQLVKVGATAVLGATLEIVVMALVGYQLGRLFGWSTMDSIFLGATLSMSSTTIIIKALGELGMMKQRFAELIFGILIVEDILAMAMLALLSGIAATQSINAGAVVKALVELGIFLTVLLVVGLLLVPPLLRRVARFKSDEMLLITVLGLCFGVSLLAAKLEYSVALGAFIIGAIMAEAREAGRIEALVAPLRDMFSAVFFVSIGMLIVPHQLVEHWLPILVITIAVVVVKVPTSGGGAFLAGNDLHTSMRAGMGLAQIGEFSFIILQLGLTLGVISDFLYPVVVSVSAVTTLLTPYLIKGSDRFTSFVERAAPNTILGFLETYHEWVTNLGQAARGGNQVRKLLRKWALQIGLNMALIAGILIAAKAFARWVERRGSIPVPRDVVSAPRAVTWLAAMLLALPLLVATLRKVRAVAQVLAEIHVQRRSASTDRASLEHTRAARALVANAIFFAAAVAVGLVVLGLSAALLPPWPVLVVLLLLIVAIAVWRWNSFVKMYASAQIALRETLTQQRQHVPAEPEQRALPLLANAVVESVEIAPDSPGAGKLIRELALRTRTGASAVGIERNGTSVINPGPDEELLPGDRVLLLGERAQLDAARQLLTSRNS
jgi:CPA2 family monovalent cation:H+ antiporter-2